jgi:excisionase family DNA binding protein
MPGANFRPILHIWLPIWYTGGMGTLGIIHKGAGMKQSPYMTAAEAQKYLDISKKKMAQLIRSGRLATEDDPLDGRVKLVKRADVEKLAARSAKKSAA